MAATSSAHDTKDDQRFQRANDITTWISCNLTQFKLFKQLAPIEKVAFLPQVLDAALTEMSPHNIGCWKIGANDFKIHPNEYVMAIIAISFIVQMKDLNYAHWEWSKFESLHKTQTLLVHLPD